MKRKWAVVLGVVLVVISGGGVVVEREREARKAREELARKSKPLPRELGEGFDPRVEEGTFAVEGVEEKVCGRM